MSTDICYEMDVVYKKERLTEQCNQNYTEANTTNSSINKLNNDCLLLIFHYLPIVDRIRIERVCKHWKNVSQGSWHNMKSLDLHNSSWGFLSETKTKQINISTLQKVLSRCGKFLREIHLTNIFCETRESALCIIGNLCPNLQIINLGYLQVTSTGITSLANNCHNITKLSLDTICLFDKDLEKLFKANRKLQYLRLIDNNISGKCLLHLPPKTMEEIIIERCDCVCDDDIVEAIANLKNLKCLIIKECFDVWKKTTEATGKYCTNLRTLEIIGKSSLLQFNGISHITSLTDLINLKVSANWFIGNSILRKLNLHCQQLIYLDLSDIPGHFIRDYTLQAIEKFTNLEVLITHDLYQVTSNDFLNYGNISETTEDDVPIRKLFVSNLAERTTYKDLNILFSKYGNVESCFLIRNQGKSNYAFVTFDTVASAVRARNEGIQLHNRCLRVEAADSWHQPDNIENQYYSKDWQKSYEKQLNEPCNEIFIQSNITDTSIQILNDDCLIHIFLQLPIIDRVRIERVCKRWRALSQESWKSVKKLDLLCMDSSVLSSLAINTPILRKILLRCGRFLNEINLSQVESRLSPSTLTIVGKLCPNLQRIDVTALTVSLAGINSLMKNCRNITKLSLGPTTYICDRDLQKLFKLNPKLRYFKVVTGKICGKCLLHLPLETMEEIVLERCSYLQIQCLSQAIEKLQNLKSLTIKNCLDVSTIVMQTIGMHCTNLKMLELSELYMPIRSNEILHIAQLTNLEVLKVSRNAMITDEFLSNLASKCQQLIYLDISECDSVTSVGIAAVATLQKLETLIMNDMFDVTETDMQGMCSLKKLECRGCFFGDTTMIKLLASAPQLELLDLSYCHGITNFTLKKAAKVTVSRTNSTVLKIFVGNTAVNLKKFEEVSPFLHIVNVAC
ncbi:PREDICTED: uncharacterized protein LOC107189129 [Dufourea novaeangliae]|uniref:Putative RNA-binding protein EEED8.10 n=1 Tax=Dufourea novaeangliae TaxID=178035 RepID=A0A154PGR8_DUFNO|nr:PREDICTED: uncharacterized protein LOC107189129 [Dufourea novaeangliae]KZC11051.1 Putative RNA-binding protein EEED8.10 [Dufourea novaeangliae]